MKRSVLIFGIAMIALLSAGDLAAQRAGLKIATEETGIEERSVVREIEVVRIVMHIATIIAETTAELTEVTAIEMAEASV